ncbi:CCAAT/enhancer-binding protein gamma-like [Ochlerotatus camptorhynchus]|uniref:CCAAT/enhancer-binding protein gamma-like n=1 Tax=Ochlerotatus camptorhynchus TaxID=644619 RepID=UPI0031D23C56
MAPKRRATTTNEYRNKRDQNNEAVKRSRVKSKQRTEENQTKVKELLIKNQVLEDKIENQKKDLQFLKELFVAQANAKADKLVGVNLLDLFIDSDHEGGDGTRSRSEL